MNLTQIKDSQQNMSPDSPSDLENEIQHQAPA